MKKLKVLIKKMLEDLPSAEKRGWWIDMNNENAWNYCSVCGEQSIDLYNYCPNCGARMEAKDEED